MRLETLIRRADFLRLKKGASWSTLAFVLQVSPSLPHAHSPTPRFGFTVSDRAVRESEDGGVSRAGAVKRNRARRRLKEAVRLAAPGCARPSFDYVVIGRRAALTMEFTSLVQSMREAFAKVHEPRRRRTERKPDAIKAPG
jgi:ribonuclease P protein component